MVKRVATAFAAGMLVAAGLLLAQARRPSSVIHVVTVKWVDGTTQEQIDEVLRGVQTLAAEHPGIERIWLRSIKVQGTETGATHAFVMEFASEQALEAYTGSEAQRKWYELYLPVRDQSWTFDITN